MSEEEEERFSPEFGGPLDQAGLIPIAALLDDPHRRNILLSPTQEYEERENPNSGTTILIPHSLHPEAASIIAAGLSTQHNLLNLSANLVRAKKIEYGIITWLGGIKYRRNTEVATSLRAAKFSFGLTMDGMAEQGSFSGLLTRLSGSLREFITGTRSDKK